MFKYDGDSKVKSFSAACHQPAPEHGPAAMRVGQLKIQFINALFWLYNENNRDMSLCLPRTKNNIQNQSY